MRLHDGTMDARVYDACSSANDDSSNGTSLHISGPKPERDAQTICNNCQSSASDFRLQSDSHDVTNCVLYKQNRRTTPLLVTSENIVSNSRSAPINSVDKSVSAGTETDKQDGAALLLTCSSDMEKSDSTDKSKSKHSDSTEDGVDSKKGKFSFKKLSREQIIILITTSVTNLLSYITLSILAPFFPKEASKKGVSDSISGWIFGIFALVQFLASPLVGKILPVVGTRFMYVSGLFVCGVCTLLFGFLDLVPVDNGTTTFVVLCFLVRIVLALGCTSLNNAGFVLIVRSFPNDVAQVFGIGEIFVGVGMVIGPAIGGFLYVAGGFLLPFAVPGGLCLAAFPLVWWSLPVQDDRPLTDTTNLSWFKLVTHPESMVNSIVIILAASIWAILDPTLEPHLRVYGLTPEIVGVLFLIMAACYSLTSPLWGWIADRIPDNRALLIPGLLLATVGLLLLGPSELLGFDISYNELPLTIVSLVIIGVACALCIIPTYDIYIGVLDQLGYPEETSSYSMISGLWVAMYGLGEFIGPSLGGVLFDSVGFEWMTTYVAGASLACGD